MSDKLQTIGQFVMPIMMGVLSLLVGLLVGSIKELDSNLITTRLDVREVLTRIEDNEERISTLEEKFTRHKENKHANRTD